MGRDFENVKDIFMRLYVNNRRYVTEEEISKLTAEEMINLEYDSDKGERYILEPMELSDEEFKVYLQMKQVDQLNEQDRKLQTIKNILVFWLILTLIPLVISLFVLMFR